LRLPLGSITGAEAPTWADAPDLPDPRRDPPAAASGDGDDRDARHSGEMTGETTGEVTGQTTGQARRDAAAPATTPPARPRAPEALPGIRTALAIEPRDGVLWVFVPPVGTFEDFCALIAAIDRAREATGLAVELEGYAPPPSPERLRFAVTPDPGVLEVNVPPVASCREATALYHAMFEAGL